MQNPEAIWPPDLSSRPFHLTIERMMRATPAVLFRAWTEHMDRWFATPGTVIMKAEVNAVFFWEVHHEADRYPHYGRFLRLEPDQLVELTWITGPMGTKGIETVVTVTFAPEETGTRLQLMHAGFLDQESRDGHERAWPGILAHLDEQISA